MVEVEYSVERGSAHAQLAVVDVCCWVNVYFVAKQRKAIEGDPRAIVDCKLMLFIWSLNVVSGRGEEAGFREKLRINGSDESWNEEISS